MTIPASSYVPPFLNPNLRAQLVDSDGVLTTHGQTVINQLVIFLNGSNRIVPCNAGGINIISLFMLQTSPLITKYNDFDTFRATATATTTGNVTALVITPQGALATLKVFKSSGSTQATTGDVVINLLYDFIYVDSLDSGNGGFVLR